MARWSIVHMTSVHPPLDSRIFYSQCVGLAQHGHDVTLVAPQSGDRAVDGVRILGVPPGRRGLRRPVLTGLDVYRRARLQPADLYHFHDPELIPFALLLKAAGRRVVMDVHEDQPGAILHLRPTIPSWVRSPAARTAGVLESAAARCLDGIVTVTDTIAARFPRHKTILFRNFPNPGTQPTAPRRPIADRPQRVVMAGTLGELQCVPVIVDAMALLPEALGARLTLAGAFVPAALRERVERSPGWARTDYHGQVSREAVSRMLADARAGLVLYAVPEYSREFSSRKLYELMAQGVPIVTCDIPSWRTTVERYGCGIAIETVTPEALACAIQRLLECPDDAEAMGQAGLRVMTGDYSWEREYARLSDLYQRILALA